MTRMLERAAERAAKHQRLMADVDRRLREARAEQAIERRRRASGEAAAREKASRAELALEIQWRRVQAGPWLYAELASYSRTPRRVIPGAVEILAPALLAAEQELLAAAVKDPDRYYEGFVTEILDIADALVADEHARCALSWTAREDPEAVRQLERRRTGVWPRYFRPPDRDRIRRERERDRQPVAERRDPFGGPGSRLRYPFDPELTVPLTCPECGQPLRSLTPRSWSVLPHAHHTTREIP